MQRFIQMFWVVVGLHLAASACSPNPLPPTVHLADGTINYFNDSLPAQLPRFSMVEDGAGLFLGGEQGHPSYLLNPGAADRSRFTADTIWSGRNFDYLTFYDEEEANYNYAASTFSPEDSSRFGPSASILEISTPRLYRKDNPEDSALGYLSVAWHEMAHLTEHWGFVASLRGTSEKVLDDYLRELLVTE